MAKKWDKEFLRQNLSQFNKAVENEKKNMTKFTQDRLNQTLKFFDDLVDQIPLSMSGPLLSKTPAKPKPKKTSKKIMTIPEDDVAEPSDSAPIKDEEPPIFVRPKRTSRVSKKVQEVVVKTEPVDDVDILPVRQTRASKRINSIAAPKDSPKVKKSRTTSKKPVEPSSEEESEEEVPILKTKKSSKSKTVRSLSVELDSMVEEPVMNATVTISKPEERGRKRTNQTDLDQSLDEQPEEPPKKKANLEKPGQESNVEISFYEDAVEKHNILSSTMNLNELKKKSLLQPTVMLSNLPAPAASNETFVVEKKPSKKSSLRISQKKSLEKPDKVDKVEKKIWPTSSCSSVDSLMTDDESEHPAIQKQTNKRKLRSSLLSEDEVEATPPPATKTAAKQKTLAVKNNFKNGALFSPYAKESVKKRVEAFEQVAAASPQKEAGQTRVTRTKTRAQKAANEDQSDNKKSAENSEDESDAKENLKKQDKLKQSRLPQSQLKYTTPMGKNRIPVPTSTSKMYTPVTASSHTKPLTATRHNNLVSNVDSFIPKSTSKFSSADKSEDKRRKLSTTEDAKLKRDIQLKAMTEEKKKKREIKEQKIKQAREQKEKAELEKRLKAEKEKEEKAKLAQIAQEKAREEAEKKRLAHLQRQQEKEERRKKEEQARLLKAQEQEELERQLAEQRRQEHELEKKKLAEARAYQQYAQAEALKQKMLAKKLAQAKKVPNTYKLDSEPDDDSDCENNPKHPIPEWASSSAREQPLIVQSYVPKEAVMRLFNTTRCTPDLTKLFDGISKSRLKRTSSAIWKSPPRYSMMYENL